MKANELMIGDWVYNKNIDKPMQVYPTMFSQMFRTRPDATTEDYNIFPIPITAEILEKNGFSKTTEAEFNYYQMPDDCFEIDINNVGCAYSVDVIIKYVHQLQHALRLCGIDKEIVL